MNLIQELRLQIMGFLKKVFGAKEVLIDPVDLRIPEEVATDKPGLTLKKAPVGQPIDIKIVGESFRAANIAAVAKAAAGKEFDIYIIPEPMNQYDKKAVAVYAANVHVGYIANPDNKQWFKWVNEAIERGELLWGIGRAVSRSGTSNSGIFGSIYMLRVGREADELIAQKLTDSALAKAIEKVISLSNDCIEPDTIAQLKSLAKKAVAVASPFAAHAKWITDNPDGQDVDAWEEIQSICVDIFEAFSEAAYATEDFDLDVVGNIESLTSSVESLQKPKEG